MSQRPQKNIDIGYVLAVGGELGFLIAFPLVICIVLGIYIDKRLGTFPWLLLASVLLGMILTVVNVYKVVIPFLEKRSEKDKDNKKIK